MTAEWTAIAPVARPVSTRPKLRPGWITIAGKEFADHLLSVRLYAILLVLGVAAVVPLFFAANYLRDAAAAVNELAAAGQLRAVFLALFTIQPQGIDLGPISFTVQAFVAMAAPLLGIAFAFDSVNGERHEGTLPRLVSQPIHRDDVINGKFAGGLAAIALALTIVVLVISGYGMVSLGIMPSLDEIIRLVLWLAVTILYVALWLAFGMLLSVVIRRAATSALVGFGTWLFVAMPFVGPLLLGLVGQYLASGATSASDAYGTLQWLQRLLPGTVYSEASAALLSPTTTSVSYSDIYSSQFAQQVPTQLSFDRSFEIVIPQIVLLFALTVACFVLAYIRFMRQEVRA
ncbi:MAG TPA: ABC transporter permease [Candidatus Limnocylindrales bacterium]|nr:ABC transporter permease [Candidatus Limnocylindrales bacterium]